MLVEAHIAATGERIGDAVPAPAVSVLIPVRNGAAYLGAALESLAAQTWTDFEIVVVDNGSSDRTAFILRDWARREPRLRFFSLDRPGVSASRNFAAARARAPLLAYLDADDVALPHRLAVQVAAMNARPSLALLGSAAELIDSNGSRIGSLRRPLDDARLREFQRSSSGFIQSSVIMRRESFLAAGGYREGLRFAEDYDLWLRMAERGRIANLAQPLVRYRMHANGATARGPARQALAIHSVDAAREARRLGTAEPFLRGVPLLRIAAPLLGLTPAHYRRQLRLTALRLGLARRYQALPLPRFVKGAVRLAAIRLGLRRPIVLALGWMVSRPRRRS